MHPRTAVKQKLRTGIRSNAMQWTGSKGTERRYSGIPGSCDASFTRWLDRFGGHQVDRDSSRVVVDGKKKPTHWSRLMEQDKKKEK